MCEEKTIMDDDAPDKDDDELLHALYKLVIAIEEGLPLIGAVYYALKSSFSTLDMVTKLFNQKTICGDNPEQSALIKSIKECLAVLEENREKHKENV